VKYAVIIASGAADAPVDELDGLTPLEAAATPTLDRLARAGRVGTVDLLGGTEPDPVRCLSAILGYEPDATGLTLPAMAAEGSACPLNDGEWAFRIDLVHADSAGVLTTPALPGLPPAEADLIFRDLLEYWRSTAPGDAQGLELITGLGSHAVLIDRSGRDHSELRAAPAWAVSGEPWRRHLPLAPGGPYRESADRIIRLIEVSGVFLEHHEANRGRADHDLLPANLAWISEPAPAIPQVVPRARHGIPTAAFVSGSVAHRATAARLGFAVIDPKREPISRSALHAIDRYELVVVHDQTAEHAGDLGDWERKTAAIAAIDRTLVTPIADKLMTFGDAESSPDRPGWRLLVLPDRHVLCETRAPDPAPVPFAMAGAWVRSIVPRTLAERTAAESDLHVDHGHELLEYVLRGGMARVRPPSR
jgi:2,3-bisphosphoglycerate-independent phosphoglycerate mutase